MGGSCRPEGLLYPSVSASLKRVQDLVLAGIFLLSRIEQVLYSKTALATML
jgi:hypothetical protein